MKVGFQGIRGAYSEMAAQRYFKQLSKPIDLRAFDSFEKVFAAVMQKKIRYAVLPIENSLAGSIHENYDHLLHHDVWICGEYKLKIDHSLLACKGARLSDIKSVYSHPQALAQCASYLRGMDVDILPYFDTAGSARFVADSGRKDMAAIAGAHAAKDYNLRVLASSIQDDVQNYTRFFVLEKKPKQLARLQSLSHPKTSIVFSLKNVPGGLHKALSVFAIRDIDLTKIESRPLRGSPWKYLFYLDFEGSYREDHINRALSHLDEITENCRVLGSYEQSK